MEERKIRSAAITHTVKDNPPEGWLDLSDDDTWRRCLSCNGNLTQVRKALFTCTKCGLEYIGVEEDMRPDGYKKL